jgi:hypothetical protein
MNKIITLLSVYFFCIFLTGCLSKKEQEIQPLSKSVSPGGTQSDTSKVSLPVTPSEYSYLVSMADIGAGTSVDDGLLVIQNDSLLAKIKAGSILACYDGGGFLVRVTEVSGNSLKVEPASLDELFTDGQILFDNYNAGGSTQRISDTDFDISIDKELLREKDASLSFSGNLNFRPQIQGDISFTNKTFNTDLSGSLTISGKINVKGRPDGLVNLSNEVVLGEYSKKQLISIPGPIPFILVTYKLKLKDRITITGVLDLDTDIEYKGYYNIHAALGYNGGWTNTFSFSNGDNSVTKKISSEASVTIRNELIPELAVEFYGAVMPYMKFVAHSDFDYRVKPFDVVYPAWDHTAKVGLDYKAGITNRLFKKFEYYEEWPVGENKIIYQAPGFIQRSSGSYQTVMVGDTLTEPLVVCVYDMDRQKLAGALVKFEILNGDGKLTQKMCYTNSSGYASTNLIANSAESNIRVKATLCTPGEEGSLMDSEFLVYTASSEMTATINGFSWEAGRAYFDYENYIIGSSGEKVTFPYIYGFNDNSREFFGIGLKFGKRNQVDWNNFKPGTYTMGYSSDQIIRFCVIDIDANQSCTWDAEAGSGELTITSVDNGYVKGTFNFSTASGVYKVTNGKFRIKLPDEQ